MPKPYNVLWICTDSQRWDTLGCYGNRFVKTPHLDRLAREGVRFENAFAQSPLCTPSRGSFLTGRYPITNRLRQNGQTVPEDLKPVTRTLRDSAGYSCALSGKLHLSACDKRLTYGPEWWKLPDRHWYVPFEKRIDDGYGVFHWDHAPGRDHPNSAYTQWLYEKGIRDFPKSAPHPDCPRIQKGWPADLHQTTFCTEKAVDYIELHKLTQAPYPWLFSVNIFDPHPAYDPPEEYLQPYLDKLENLPLPVFAEGELDAKPRYQKERYAADKGLSTRGWSDRDRRMIKAAYWAMCDLIDVNVGKLLDALERTGQRDHTLIIFTSDHGELLGDHGRIIKGPYLYEGAVHVPLIISLPGVVQENLHTSALVELTDLAPTVLEAAGLPRDRAMQGRSLWPILTGQAPAEHFRDDVYCEYYNANPDKPSTWLTMLRTRTHKLIALHGANEGELYDLEKDPGENRNLWADPSAQDLKIELLLRMAARMAYTADPLPERIGVY